MSDFNSIKAQIQSLIDSANATTGNTDTNLTDGVNALIGGYGQGDGGIEDGYDVTFYDENGNILAFISVKQGDSVNAPNYACKHWQTEDETKIDFPYIPTGDISLYANNDTYASLLYKHYGVDVGVYPYLTIRFNDSNGATSIIFAKSIDSGYYKNVLQCLGGSDSSAPNPSDDLEVFLSYVMGKYTSANLSTSSDDIFNAFPYMLTNFDLSGMTAYGGGNFDSSVCIRLDIDETEEKLPFDGLENGYDVMFYDENNEELAFYSIKEGNELGSPICEYNRWVTSDGMYKFFPCTPNEDMTLYGRIEGIEGVLYNHFGVSKTDYPYLTIIYNSSYDLSVTFSKSYTENGNTWQGNNVKHTTSKRIGSLSEINEEIMLQKVVETFSRADLQESTSQSTSIYSNYTVLSNFNINSISNEYRIEDFEDKLYTKYGVSKNDYPYLFIIHNVNSSYLEVCFFKTITTNSSNRLEYKNFMSGNITLPQALNNIDLVILVDSAISNISSVALGSTTAGAWPLASNHYFASNFDVDATSLGGEYRLDE